MEILKRKFWVKKIYQYIIVSIGLYWFLVRGFDFNELGWVNLFIFLISAFSFSFILLKKFSISKLEVEYLEKYSEFKFQYKKMTIEHVLLCLFSIIIALSVTKPDMMVSGIISWIILGGFGLYKFDSDPDYLSQKVYFLNNQIVENGVLSERVINLQDVKKIYLRDKFICYDLRDGKHKLKIDKIQKEEVEKLESQINKISQAIGSAY